MLVFIRQKESAGFLEMFHQWSTFSLSARHVHHPVCLKLSLCPCLSASISQSIHLSPSYPLPARRSVMQSLSLSLSLSVRITWRQVGQHGRRWWGNKMFLSAQSRFNPLSSSPTAEPDYRKLGGGFKTDARKKDGLTVQLWSRLVNWLISASARWPTG